MEQPLMVLEAQYNKHNFTRCELFADRVVLSTHCTGGFLPVYRNATRTIEIADIRQVIISSGGMKYFIHHPNAVHFVTDECTRTLDDMFRDNRFHASSYIDEGVQQFCAKSETDLAEKIGIASRMKEYIENVQKGI